MNDNEELIRVLGAYAFSDNNDAMKHSKMAHTILARHNKKKIDYAITALLELRAAYDADNSLAEINDDDRRASQIIHESLVKQRVEDNKGMECVEYVEKYIRKLF